MEPNPNASDKAHEEQHFTATDFIRDIVMEWRMV